MHEISCSAERPPNRTATRRLRSLTPSPGRGRSPPGCPRASSMPADTRTRPSAMPAARRASGAICRCVVEAAWPTRVCVPPRLVATQASSSASQNRCPALHPARDLHGQHPAEPARPELPLRHGVLRMRGQARVAHALDLGVGLQERRQRHRVLAVPIHAQRQRHEAAQAEPRFERRHGPPVSMAVSRSRTRPSCDVHTTPPIRSWWPPMYFVAECST